MKDLEDKTQSAYIVVRESSIVEVSDAFISIFGFVEEDILWKPLHEVWNDWLRINLDPNTTDTPKEAILFTKSLDARFVILQPIKNNDAHETKYCFTEIPGSRFEEHNQFLERSIIDNIKHISVYSVPDFIMIKANQAYLDNMPKPYNKKESAYGKHLKDFDSNFVGSIAEKLLLNVVNTNQTLIIKEHQGLMAGNENIYWDVSITPVSENGKVKYIVLILDDVTKSVMDRKHVENQSELIESQNREIELKQKQLKIILDNLNDAVCLYNCEGSVVFANKAAFDSFDKYKFSDPNTAVSSYKYYSEEGSELPNAKLPITRALREGRVVSAIVKAVCCEEEHFVDVSAIPIFDNCGALDFVITVNRDITEKYLSQKQIVYKNNELESIIENISDILAVVDKSGKFILQNKAAKNILLGKSNINNIHEYTKLGQAHYSEDGKECDLPCFSSHQIIKGGKIEEQRIIIKDEFGERHVDVSANPVFDEEGEFKFGVITGHDVTKLVQRDNEIRQHQEYLNVITENMIDGLMIINPDGTIPYMNKSACDLFYQPGNHKKNGDSLAHTKYFDEKGNEILQEDIPGSRVLRGEYLENYILKAVRPDKTLFMSFNGKPVYLNDKLVCAILCIQDITEQSEIKEELMEVNNRLSVALESVGAGILELDVRSGNQIWSPKMYEIYGIVPSEPMPLDKGLATLHPDDREGARRSLEEAYKSHCEFWQREFRIVNPKRGIVWINGTAKIIYDKMGNAIKHTGINIDISEQKKAEDALRISELRLSTALKGSPVVVFSQDCELRYTWVYNPSPGFKVEDVLGKRDDGIYSPEDSSLFMAIKRAVLASGAGRRDEVTTHRPDSAGGNLIHDMTTEPLHDMNGVVVGVICAAIDITERKKAESEREQLLKERNEALEASIKLKDEFLYLITHEFKTPMAVVNSALQAIELIHKKDVTEKVAKYLKTIKQNTNRQLRLVNNLLDITRINSGNIKLNKSSFDIVYVTKEIVNSVALYAEHKRISLNFISDTAKKVVFLDEEKYERILLNLLANAVKFTPHGKNISITLYMRKKRSRNMVCISVADEGIGIPIDKQKVIFERFGQVDSSLSRQAEGTGLGLHLVKLFVDALKGEIMLKSKVGVGSTFTVAFPDIEMTALEELAVSSEGINKYMSNDSRILQAVSVEFSDIYFD